MITVESIEYHESNYGIPSFINIILREGPATHSISANCRKPDAEAIANKMGLILEAK